MAKYELEFNHRSGKIKITRLDFNVNNLTARVQAARPYKLVVVLELDGDDLDAALWGLTNYIKPGCEPVVEETAFLIQHSTAGWGCTCGEGRETLSSSSAQRESYLHHMKHQLDGDTSFRKAIS